MSGTAGVEVAEALAIDGGEPVRRDPFPPRRLFGEEEKAAAAAVFDRCIETGEVYGYGGAETRAYLSAFTEWLGGGHAVACSSGTAAVYVALRALRLPPYSEVIVPPVSDPGGFMPVPLVNCIPVPADSVAGGYNTGAEQIAARVTDRTSAILVAHIAGTPVDMDPILELARRRNLPVIEDAAQSHGALYKGRPVGTLGTIAAFSTMSGKHHATGGQGGVVFTRDEALYDGARRAADRGKPFGLPAGATNATASLNFNLDDLSAAIGCVQLRKLPGIVERRRNVARAIGAGCAGFSAVHPQLDDPPRIDSSFWFLFVRLDPSRLTVDRDGFVRALAAEGVPVMGSYLNTMEAGDWYRNRDVFGDSKLPWSSPRYGGDPDATYPIPNVRATDAAMFRIRIHENWTDREVRDTVAALAKVERAYLKPVG